MRLGVLFNTDRLDHREFVDYAQRVESLGFESLWLPELFTRDPFAAAGFLLGRTSRLTLATGIANVYARDPTSTVSAASALHELSDGRFVLGLGVSNAGLNEARGHVWEKPVAKLRGYLDAMSNVRLTSPQSRPQVHIAAHGPKMLDLAAELSDGANTYLMPPEHVTEARTRLGERELNTMLFALRDADPISARATARKAVSYYFGLDYYHRAWRAFGFDDEDFANGGSDRLIDAVVAWGSVSDIKARIGSQFERGATRVVVIPVGAGMGGHPDWDLLSSLQERSKYLHSRSRTT